MNVTFPIMASPWHPHGILVSQDGVLIGQNGILVGSSSILVSQNGAQPSHSFPRGAKSGDSS